MNMQKAQQGFTLIELMIVVAIIGVLASIAIPAYQDYIIKSEAASALTEVSPGKMGFEMAINVGKLPSTTVADAGYIGIPATTTYCAIAITATTIVCTTTGGNATYFNGKTITWTRAVTDGSWACTSDLNAKYLPGKCS